MSPPKISRAGQLRASDTANVVSEDEQPPPVLKQPPPVLDQPHVFKRVLKFLGTGRGFLAAGFLIFLAFCNRGAIASFQKASSVAWTAIKGLTFSDWISLATAIIVPAVIWYVKIPYDHVSNLSVEIKSFSNDLNGKISELKNDIKSAKDEVKGEITEVKGELNGKINEVKNDIKSAKDELKGEITEVKGELNGKINEVKNDIKSAKDEVKGEVKSVRNNVADLVKAVHEFEVRTVKEQAALEVKALTNLLFAQEKRPSTDAESAS